MEACAAVVGNFLQDSGTTHDGNNKWTAPCKFDTLIFFDTNILCRQKFDTMSSLLLTLLLLLTTTTSTTTASYVSSSEQYDYHSNGNSHGIGLNGEKLTPIESMIQLSSTPRHRQNLTCHVCHSEKQPECIDFDKFPDANYSSPCSQKEHICMVRRFSFTVSNGSMVPSAPKTFAVKRNCSAKCEPGCVVMGERTRIYVCSTCCTSPLCNVGSTAATTTTTIISSLTTIIISIATLIITMTTTNK